MGRYDEANCTKESNMVQRQTLRERLKSKIEYSERGIREYKQQIKEAETGLKKLDENKDLEILVNLMQQ